MVKFLFLDSELIKRTRSSIKYYKKIYYKKLSKKFIGDYKKIDKKTVKKVNYYICYSLNRRKGQ